MFAFNYELWKIFVLLRKNHFADIMRDVASLYGTSLLQLGVMYEVDVFKMSGILENRWDDSHFSNYVSYTIVCT